MPRIPDTLHRHRHFFVLLAILILVMTFPTIVYVFNTEVFWLPTGNHPDTWRKFWDAWYGKQILAGQADFFYTDLLFYPQGVSLVFHNFSIPHMLVFASLQAFMPPSNAYSLTFLLIVAAVTCSAYLYMLYLFKDKWIALLGAVIIGFSPHVVGYPEHPEYRFIATVPIALYFFHRGLAERRTKLVFYAALTTSLTAYVSMHVTVCLVFMLGMMFFYFLALRWKDKTFWAAMTLFAATAALVSSIRVAPMLASANALETALGSYREVNNDLLEYFINARHPLTELLLPHHSFAWELDELNSRYSSYLGYSVLFLIGIGFLNKSYRRRMIPWLVMAVPFLVLRLGSVLTIGGVSFSQILLPKHYLDELLPAVTESFRVVSAFHLGALIPLAVLACFGASALMSKLRYARPPLIILVIVGVVCFEFYQPVRQGITSEQELEFVNWLQNEPGDVRLVSLPFGGWTAPSALLHQTYHGYPIAGGKIARKSLDQDAYIRANTLLKAWRLQQSTNCSMHTREQYLFALDQLLVDGFTHVALHKQDMRDSQLTDNFIGIDASYEDDYVLIFRMDDLAAPCDFKYMAEFFAEFFAAFPYAGIYLGPSIIHERNGPVISFHQSQAAPEAFSRYFSDIISFDRKHMLHFSYSNSDELVVQGTQFLRANLENVVGAYNGIWVINNPQETDLSLLPVFQDWLRTSYRFCHRYLDRPDATVDLYLKPGIPCDAMGDQNKLEVIYESGARLQNLSYNLADNHVTFYLVWITNPDQNYAFSIQLFDEFGQKALQYDDAVYRDAVAVHSMDVSRLRDGTYDVKLIVYDIVTGVSERGTVVEGNRDFDRMLDIGSIYIGQGAEDSPKNIQERAADS